ncbi:MAG TPA: type I-B CRISPR-associated protein Cas5 [Candidatus Cloacimonetes bacterium]|nr:type I-B CRISPR-associated protein Cas5 [Candidatus Cloacimonadota bacterium]
MDKILKFKIWGDYAHFKKFYTTTSPLTFEFPPPPTIIGIISAIIGLDKNEYLEHFQNPDEFKIALSIQNLIKKVRWTQNLIDTKQQFWRIKNRTQIRIEFLKDSAFVIYFSHKDGNIYDQLKKNLENHTSVYSISLGLSELLANFEFIDEIEIENSKSDDWIKVDSVLPYSCLQDDNSVDFEISREIFKVNFPILMQPNRIVNKREDILFERNGKPIKSKVTQFWKTEEGNNIVFF